MRRLNLVLVLAIAAALSLGCNAILNKGTVEQIKNIANDALWQWYESVTTQEFRDAVNALVEAGWFFWDVIRYIQDTQTEDEAIQCLDDALEDKTMPTRNTGLALVQWPLWMYGEPTQDTLSAPDRPKFILGKKGVPWSDPPFTDSLTAGSDRPKAILI